MGKKDKIRSKGKQTGFQRKKKKQHRDFFKAMKEYVDYFTKFNRQLEVLGLQAKDVEGDGNCLFRAIADQLQGDQSLHMIYRGEACRIMQNQKQYFSPFLDEDDGSMEVYLHRMSKDKQWGGELQLIALCKAARLRINLFREDQLQPSVFQFQEPKREISLCYFSHQLFDHYASVRKIGLLQGPAWKKLGQEWLFEAIQQLQQMKVAQQREQQQEEEPFPGLGRNKKCLCGSKLSYKDCCLKQFIKKKEQRF